jgi:hypothetical protein
MISVVGGPVILLADTQMSSGTVTNPARLTDSAIRTIEEATALDATIGGFSLALVEMACAVEKAANPLTPDDLDAIARVLVDPESPFEVIPL